MRADAHRARDGADRPARSSRATCRCPSIGDDDALLRVEACGICGSDVESFEGVLKVPLPLIPGHEPLGVIEAIGERAAQRWGVRAGDRVAVETLLPCNACRRCRGGAYQLCASRRVYSYIPLGVAPGLWGAYAEYLYLAPNAIVHKVDSGAARRSSRCSSTRSAPASAGRSRCRRRSPATPC